MKVLLEKIRNKWHRDIQNMHCGDINLLHIKLQYLIERLPASSKDELSLLCERYGSDKGSTSTRFAHTYTFIYNPLFENIKNNVKYVFECGISTGASLRVWRDYFPSAEVYGGDINKESLFEEDRIHCGLLDQTDSDSINKYFSDTVQGNIKFDVMIDDGLHTPEAAFCLFENAFEHLSKNGYYIIEDMWNEAICKLESYLMKSKYKEIININIKRMDGFYHFDNNLVIIKRKNL